MKDLTFLVFNGEEVQTKEPLPKTNIWKDLLCLMIYIGII